MGKITKMLKNKVDPFGAVFKEKKKKKVVPRTPEQLKKDTDDAEAATRRSESAARLRNNRTASGVSEFDTLTRPGARSSKLFGE